MGLCRIQQPGSFTTYSILFALFFFFLKLLFRPTEKDRNKEEINKKIILLHVHYTSPKVDVHIVLF